VEHDRSMSSLIDTTMHVVRRIAAELRSSGLDNLGLLGLRERAHLLGGRLEYHRDQGARD
jgi:signal transduction histidine kinase